MSSTTHTSRDFNHATMRMLDKLPPYVMRGRWLRHILNSNYERVDARLAKADTGPTRFYEDLVCRELKKAGWL